MMLMILWFAGECFRQCDAVSRIWGRTRNTGSCSTLSPATTRGTGTPTTGPRGWWQARPTRPRPTGCTPTPTLPTPETSSANKSCRLKKSNSPTTRWTKTDRYAHYSIFLLSLGVPSYSNWRNLCDIRSIYFCHFNFWGMCRAVFKILWERQFFSSLL